MFIKHLICRKILQDGLYHRVLKTESGERKTMIDILYITTIQHLPLVLPLLLVRPFLAVFLVFLFLFLFLRLRDPPFFFPQRFFGFSQSSSGLFAHVIAPFCHSNMILLVKKNENEQIFFRMSQSSLMQVMSMYTYQTGTFYTRVSFVDNIRVIRCGILHQVSVTIPAICEIKTETIVCYGNTYHRLSFICRFLISDIAM